MISPTACLNCVFFVLSAQMALLRERLRVGDGGLPHVARFMDHRLEGMR